MITMEVKDNNPANWLIELDDGTTKIVGKSDTNRLLIDHGLWGLLQDGTEILTMQATEDRPKVELIPSRDAKEFTLSVADYESLHLGPHQKGRLVRVLREAKDDESDMAEALINLFDEVREDRVRSDVVEGIADRLGDTVEGTANGWLINDHLLLTWEGDFKHPYQNSYERDGSLIGDGSSEDAYDVNLRPSQSEQRDVTIDGQDYRLTNAEMEFLAKGLWAIEKAPRGI